MWAKSFGILAVALLCSGECIQLGPKGYGSAEFSAFDSRGESIPHPAIDLLEVSTRKSVRSALHDGVAKKLPYGTYLLRISAPGFRTAEREFRLDQPAVSIRVPLSVSVECGGYAEIGGTILPVQNERERWVKLVPVFGSGGGEARVGVTGMFLVSGLDDGMYYLLVVDGKTILHSETVSTGSTRIKVELGKP